ncbi:ABC transporter substrate-binding protein [Hoyosella sp. G463]|uniref:ABC transporter substrate-binding protein n=1 Tax=Lolliginicoccus lacisalsi TaxID=2742202 RepID=A0A927PKS4_9ACTN|nr:ABC transporter substrate-binding protein [Lolliginicoccus lacisalsi]MBD8505084.1 ABC transporter substrate-binding protein [Lolliginicoccus lacisalsi]
MKRWARATTAVAAIALAASCSGNADDATGETDGAAPGFPLVITDAAGKEHTFDAPPRIGCIWFGCIESMADMGIAPAAHSAPEQFHNAFNFPAGPSEHQVEDSSSAEQWAMAEVDVLITRVPESPEDAALEQAAPVFYLHHPSYGDSTETGIDAYYENMRIMGELTGEPDAAQEAIDRYEATVAALEQAAPEGAADTTVAPIFGGSEGYYLSGSENPFCDVLASNELGRCVDAETGEMNGEAFLALQPDWIAFMTDFGNEPTRDDPVWGRLDAVRDGNVYAAQTRIYCCSLRGLTHALQEYGHTVWGEEAGIPAPGKLDDFDPATDAIR